MAETKKDPILTSTITIHNKSDDSLVATATLDDIQYAITGLSAGEYYYKIVTSGYGTIIQDLTITAGETPNNSYFTVALVPGIDVVPVVLKDKDDAFITDATVKIAGIEGTYDGVDDEYDVEDVPTGVRRLTIEHSNSSYQTISRDVTIQTGVSFSDEVLYPTLEIFVKVYGIKPDNSQVDLTNKTNCLVYNLTESSSIDDTTRMYKSGGYAKITDANNGDYKLVVPAFGVVLDGTNYTTALIEEGAYLDYASSSSGQVFLDLYTNLQTK